MQQILQYKPVFINNIIKIEVKAWHDHNRTNIKKYHKIGNVDFRISVHYAMKQKPCSVNGNDDKKVFIDDGVRLLIIFCKEVSDTQEPKRSCYKKNNVAKHDPKNLKNKDY